MKNGVLAVGLIICCVLSSLAHAQAAAGAAGTDGPPAVDARALEAANRERAKQKFLGIDFGVGVGFSWDSMGEERIQEAEVVNGVVRVTKEDKGTVQVLLESHYFFEGGESGGSQIGWGPFMSIQPGADSIIQAVGLGAMVGMRRPSSTNSFNIGAGILVEPKTQILGDGIEKNKPLPAGETDVRFKEISQTAWMLIFSFSWE